MIEERSLGIKVPGESQVECPFGWTWGEEEEGVAEYGIKRHIFNLLKMNEFKLLFF